MTRCILLKGFGKRIKFIKEFLCFKTFISILITVSQIGLSIAFEAMADTQGATSSKGARGGAMSSKGATGGLWGHNFKLTLDILELQMKKKKRIKVFFMVVYE